MRMKTQNNSGRKNNGRVRLFLLCLGLLLFVSGCGPRYKTQYTYQPPASPEGKNCMLQCDNIKQQCRTNEDYRYRACESENRVARLEYSNCISEKRDHCFDRSQFCGSRNYKRCDADYRICYQNCGGIVTSSLVCVSGCEGK